MLAIESDMLRLFARQDGVRLRAGSHQDATGGQIDCVLCRAAAKPQRPSAAICIEEHLPRSETFRKPDPLLERFAHFFMVQRVARRIDEPAPVYNRGTTPSGDKLGQTRLTLLARGRNALGANLQRVIQELLG